MYIYKHKPISGIYIIAEPWILSDNSQIIQAHLSSHHKVSIFYKLQCEYNICQHFNKTALLRVNLDCTN